MKVIISDYKRYRYPIVSQGFWAGAIHRYGTFSRNTRFLPVRFPAKMLHFFLMKVSEMFLGVYIGPNARIGKAFLIEHTGCIVINSEARIGDYARIRHGVTIGNKIAEKPKDVPTIGDYIDIGAGAKILGAITIGNNVTIGANAVVLRNVPDNSIAVGVPARIIPKRNSSLSPEKFGNKNRPITTPW
ncbi:serine O-acetyltransferase [Rhizobium sp. S153]|uniref:Serine acetyltransferase n=1 Tax=Ciceribacter sichuanensis TaxID=2949647 RepID=A0ABT0VDF0_9HYPH|nr:serine O-acetyltransferase [Ciceribacter sp. S153]MCM2403914.1 serine O-acetyltransferase [Ciceribacter sp. S153]